MATVELHFLGDFRVFKSGRPVPLPPSKKTRALLAYLCLKERRFRREQLCELLWEIPDDPRGSLRWSLSKLRRLIDDGDDKRIIADRTFVSVNTADILIDVTRQRALVGDDLQQVPLDVLPQRLGRAVLQTLRENKIVENECSTRRTTYVG